MNNKKEKVKKIKKDINEKIDKLTEKVEKLISEKNKKKIDINSIATKGILISIFSIFTSIFLLKLGLSSKIVQTKVLEYLASGIPLLNLASGDFLYHLMKNLPDILRLKNNIGVYGSPVGFMLFLQNKINDTLKNGISNIKNLDSKIPGEFPRRDSDELSFYDALEEIETNDNYFKKFIKLKPDLNSWFNYIIFRKRA